MSGADLDVIWSSLSALYMQLGVVYLSSKYDEDILDPVTGLLEIKGKQVQITGAGSGIGAEVAERLAQQGYHLIVSGSNRAKLEALCEKLPTSSSIEGVDLSQSQEVAMLCERLREIHPPLDIAFINAASVQDVGDAFMKILRTGKLEVYVPYSDSISAKIIGLVPGLIPKLLLRFLKSGEAGRAQYIKSWNSE